MRINKETVRYGMVHLLMTILSLPEVERVEIKGIWIRSVSDAESIQKALDESYHDVLSDVDFSVWVRQSARDFSSGEPVYKKHFSRLGLDGKVFGVVFQKRDERGTEVHRVCLMDGFRADLIFNARLDAAMEDLPDGEEGPKECGASFWFMAVQALAKLLRGDHLISDHLAHMLIMEGLVLQMEERDQAYHTNFHRYGYSEKLKYRDVDMEEYGRFLRKGEEDFNQVAQNLIRAVVSYDRMRSERDPKYKQRSRKFFEIWDAYLNGKIL